MRKSREEIALFLKELTELTHKHGLYIHGCGCCGSPLLYDVENENKNNFYSVYVDSYIEDLTFGNKDSYKRGAPEKFISALDVPEPVIFPEP